MIEDTPQEESLSRRQSISLCTKALALSPLVVSGVISTANTSTGLGYDLSGVKMPNRQVGDLAKTLAQTSIDLTLSIKALHAAYRRNYNSTTMPDGGKLGENLPGTLIRHKYDPVLLPSHSAIDTWYQKARSIDEKIGSFTQGELVNPRAIKKIAIDAHNGNDQARTALSALAYTGLAASALCYEKGYALYQEPAHYSLHLEAISSPARTSRRNVVKLLAAGTGFLSTLFFSSVSEKRTANRENALKDEIKQAQHLAEREDQEIVESYFGSSFEAMEKSLQMMINSSLRANKLNGIPLEVEAAFDSVTRYGISLLSEIIALKEDPDRLHELADLVLSVEITASLKEIEKNGGKNEFPYNVNDDLFELIKFLGISTSMAGVIIAGEMIDPEQAPYSL